MAIEQSAQIIDAEWSARGIPTRGGVYPWEFAKKRREFRVRVEGQLIFNGIAPVPTPWRSAHV